MEWIIILIFSITSLIISIWTIVQNNYFQKRNAIKTLSFYWEKYFEEISKIRYLYSIENEIEQEKLNLERNKFAPLINTKNILTEQMISHNYFESILSYVTIEPFIKSTHLNTKDKIKEEKFAICIMCKKWINERCKSILKK